IQPSDLTTTSFGRFSCRPWKLLAITVRLPSTSSRVTRLVSCSQAINLPCRCRWLRFVTATPDAGYSGPFLKHPYHALQDRVVVEHRPRRLAYAGDVVPIGLVHDVRDGRDIGRSRRSDARLVHDQPGSYLEQGLRPRCAGSIAPRHERHVCS